MGASYVHNNGGSLDLFNDNNDGLERMNYNQQKDDDDSVELQEIEVLGSEEEEEMDLVQVFQRKRAKTENLGMGSAVTITAKRPRTVPEAQEVEKRYFKGFIGTMDHGTPSSVSTIVGGCSDDLKSAVNVVISEKDDTLVELNDVKDHIEVEILQDVDTDEYSDDAIEILAKEERDKDNSSPVNQVAIYHQEFSEESNDDMNVNDNDPSLKTRDSAVNNDVFGPTPKHSLSGPSVLQHAQHETEIRSYKQQSSAKGRPAKRKSTLIELCAKTNPVPYRVGLSKRANISRLHDYLSR